MRTEPFESAPFESAPCPNQSFEHVFEHRRRYTGPPTGRHTPRPAPAERADPDLVRISTGSAIGGVAPVGHPERLQTVVDVALSAFDQVWAAGGHPRTVFPTSYDELLRITGGTPATVA